MSSPEKSVLTVDEDSKNYTLPCKPGDEVWLIERFVSKPSIIKKDLVSMVGITKDDIKVFCKNYQFLINRSYVWNKNAFASEDEAKEALQNISEVDSLFFDFAGKVKRAEKTVSEEA